MTKKWGATSSGNASLEPKLLEALEMGKFFEVKLFLLQPYCTLPYFCAIFVILSVSGYSPLSFYFICSQGNDTFLVFVSKQSHDTFHPSIVLLPQLVDSLFLKDSN